MKNFMYLIPLAAVALASCSNESLDSQEQRAASNPGTALNIFPAVQGTTRGTITTDANLTEFNVIAAGSDDFYTTTENVAPDVTTAEGIGSDFTETVSLNSTTGKWWIKNQSTYYWWKSKNMTASFTAYAPIDIRETSTSSTFDYQVKNELASQQDIIVAYNSGSGSDFTSGVPLNFQHVMSQVIIKALNKDASNTKIEVAGIRLSNLKNTGTLTLPTSSTASGTFSWDSYTPWSVNNNTTYTYTDRGTDALALTLESNNTKIVTLTSAATQLTDTPFLLMPQTTGKADLTVRPVNEGAYISVLIRVTNIYETETLAAGQVRYPTWTIAGGAPAAGTQFAYVAIPVDIDWKAGYKYTYTLNFSKDGIGKVDPEFALNYSGDGYPTGGASNPGEDVFDSPVSLFFTVTVDEWTDGGNSSLDM